MPSVSSTNIGIVRVAIWAYESYLGSMTAFTSLQDFVDRHRRLFVLTGAGCSTSSGIPDYHDVDGNWKREQPVRYQAFMADETTRQRYWARSYRMAPFRLGPKRVKVTVELTAIVSPTPKFWRRKVRSRSASPTN
jgi:hypothetical protein